MNIIVKNNYLYIDEFRLKCAVGTNGVKKNKIEGDGTTPSGTFKLGQLFYRKDRVFKPECSLLTSYIKKNYGWGDDPRSKFYNKLIKIKNSNLFSFEKLFRKDQKYDLIILIKYNYTNTIKNKGSAIFIHLTKNYHPTRGCITLKKKDFIILCKLINSKTKIKIY